MTDQLKCPKCGQTEKFNVNARISGSVECDNKAKILKSDFDPTNIEWEEWDWMSCPKCGHDQECKYFWDAGSQENK